jgi:predicted transcriptional regulator
VALIGSLGHANTREICDEIKATVGRKVNPVSAKRPLRKLVERGLTQVGKGRNAEYSLTDIGKSVLTSLSQ